MSEKNITPKQKNDLVKDAVEVNATCAFNEFRRQLAACNQSLDFIRHVLFNIIDVISYQGSVNPESMDNSELIKAVEHVEKIITKKVKSLDLRIGDKKDGQTNQKQS